MVASGVGVCLGTRDAVARRSPLESRQPNKKRFEAPAAGRWLDRCRVQIDEGNGMRTPKLGFYLGAWLSRSRPPNSKTLVEANSVQAAAKRRHF